MEKDSSAALSVPSIDYNAEAADMWLAAESTSREAVNIREEHKFRHSRLVATVAHAQAWALVVSARSRAILPTPQPG